MSRTIPWEVGPEEPDSALPVDDIPPFDGPSCRARWWPAGWFCNMPRDHDGHHRAGTGLRIVAEWTDA